MTEQELEAYYKTNRQEATWFPTEAVTMVDEDWIYNWE
jgi:hypothetical protein